MSSNVLLEFKKFISIFCISITALFLFTGCDNFLKGDDVKREIISAIDYNNAPTYTIHVTEIKGSGQVKTPVSGEIAKKVTDTFTIKFDPASDHQFIRWQAVIGDMNPGETADDYISFEDPGKLETKVTLKKASGDILIQPVCPQKLSVSLKDIDTAKVYPRDTTIQLQFNKPVAAECKDKVIVVIPDIPEDRTALSYFKPAEQNGQLISLFADVAEDNYSNMIPVTAAGKVITVRLNASDFYYENTDYSKTNPEKIYLENDVIFTYTINNSTSRKTKFKYKVEDNVSGAGLFRIDEENLEGSTQEYSVGKIINLKYTLTNYADYVFKGWSFTYAETDGAAAQTVTLEELAGLSYADNAQTLVYDSLTHTAQSALKLYNYNSGIITISPVVEVIPQTEILIEGTRGKISPAKGKHPIHKGELMSLSFDPDDDYEFIHWQVYDTATDQPFNYTEYLNIDINSSETSIKLLQTPPQNVQLALRPVVTERPQVISATPSYDIKGAYRDARIQVAFDRDMDENSIYLTTDEIGKLLSDPTVSELLPEYDENDTTKKYYGYKKEGSVIYKNIQITDNRDSTKNLLDCFGAPYFENAKTLIIPTNVNNYPVGGTTLLVTLDKNFFCKEQNKPITLREAKKWIYFVNSQTDIEAPEISELEIFYGDNEIEKDGTIENALWINKNSILKFYISATDLGNGLTDYFYMVFEQPDSGWKTHDPIKIYFESVAGAYANCGSKLENNQKRYYEVDLSNVLDWTYPGKYKFHLEFFDKSGKSNTGYVESTGNALKYGENETTNPHVITYVFKYDAVPPTITAPTVAACADTNDTTKTAVKCDWKGISDTQTSTSNLVIRLYYRPAVDLSASNWDDWSDASVITTFPYTVYGLEYGTTYEFNLQAIDLAGNIKSCVFKKNTMPAPFDSSKVTYEVDEVNRGIRLTASEIPQGTNGARLTMTRTSNSVYYENDSEKTTDIMSTDGVYFINGIDYAAEYDVSIKPIYKEKIDNDNRYENKNKEYTNVNDSTPVEFTDILTQPLGTDSVTLRNITNPRTENSIDISYGNTGYNFSGIKYSYAAYDKNGVLGNYTSEFQSGTSAIVNITGLAPSTKYKIKVQPYYDDQTNTCSEANAKYLDDIWTKPPAVNNLTVTSLSNSSSGVLTWNQPAGDFDKYRIWCGIGTGSSYPNGEVFEIFLDKNLYTGKVGVVVPSTGDAGISTVFYRVYTTRDNEISLNGDPVFKSGNYIWPGANLRVNNITVENITASGVTINWDQIVGHEAYLCYCRNLHNLVTHSSSSTNAVQSIKLAYGATTETFQLSDANTTFYFAFETGDGRSSSSQFISEIFTVTTQRTAANLATGHYVTNLKAEPATDSPTKIKISWTNPEDPEWRISNIRCAKADYSSSRTWFDGPDLNEGDTFCYVENLDSCAMYDFTVYSRKGESTSDKVSCNTTGHTSVETPKNLTCSARGKDYVMLTWDQPESSFENYRLYSSDGIMLFDNISPDATNLIIPGLEPNTTYSYYLTACKAPYCAAKSNVVTVTTMAQ